MPIIFDKPANLNSQVTESDFLNFFWSKSAPQKNPLPRTQFSPFSNRQWLPKNSFDLGKLPLLKNALEGMSRSKRLFSAPVELYYFSIFNNLPQQLYFSASTQDFQLVSNLDWTKYFENFPQEWILFSCPHYVAKESSLQLIADAFISVGEIKALLNHYSGEFKIDDPIGLTQDLVTLSQNLNMDPYREVPLAAFKLS